VTHLKYAVLEKCMITELLSTRFSVRQFQDKPIPEPILQSMLEAGRLSPSGGNEQPWMYGVIRDHDLIAQIAKIACNQKWLAQAPLLIVLCTIPVDDARGGRDIQCDRFPEYVEIIRQMDQNVYWALNQEEHQTKIAGAHIALAALEHGIGSCWVSRFEVKQLAILLNLPKNVLPSEILALGYPSRRKKPRPKKSLDEVVFYDTYQDRI
jgi:nitroreductase